MLKASQHNLKTIDVDFPVGKFICVTGVSSSGKSTLVNDIVYKALANRLNRARTKPGAHRGVEGIDAFDKVIEIDQRPIGRTPRSNPATYTDLFTRIRELLLADAERRCAATSRDASRSTCAAGAAKRARATGRSRSRCIFCRTCTSRAKNGKGARYNRETLEVRFKGKTIADVLDMSVEEALLFFSKIPKVRRRLRALHDVGLDYIKLGQPATTSRAARRSA